MTSVQFEPWPKMGRLTRECIITEKIDGTNAQVNIVPKCSCAGRDGDLYCSNCPTKDFIVANNADCWMFAGSRTRYVTPDNDNMGFARWVKDNAEELFALGPGRHFGEWWGGKIQRGYGIAEKRFSLFNTSRWCAHDAEPQCVNATDPNPKKVLQYQQRVPASCSVVPVLYQGVFSESAINGTLDRLRHQGSVAAPGFMRPEGIVIFHTATGVMFKKTLDKDEAPKGAA